jgi:hypothetical protein
MPVPGGGEPRGPVCAGGAAESFIFGWGKNASPLHMPDNVGFRLGESGRGLHSLTSELNSRTIHRSRQSLT